MVTGSGRTGSSSSSIASLMRPGSDEAQVLLSQDEYGCQLQLALEHSQLDPQAEHALLGTKPRPAAEALSFKYWATQGLTTEDILVNGFYELSGDFPEAGPAQGFPSLDSMHSIVPASEGQEPAREVILLNLRVDPRLKEIVQSAKAAVEDVSDLGVAARYQALARVVARAMGGPVGSKLAAQQEWLAAVSGIKQESQSVVIPIGRLGVGLSRHRALLFKFLADLCEMECRVLKGRYLDGGLEEGCAIIRYLGEERFIDLMFSPGMTHPLVRNLDQGSAPNLLVSPLAPPMPGSSRSSEQGSGSGGSRCTPPLTPRQQQQQQLPDCSSVVGFQSSREPGAWEHQQWLSASGRHFDTWSLSGDSQEDAPEEQQRQQQAQRHGMVTSRSYHDCLLAVAALALAAESRHSVQQRGMQRSDTGPPGSQLHAPEPDADLADTTSNGRCPAAGQAGVVHHAQSMPEMATAAGRSGSAASALQHVDVPPAHPISAAHEPWEAGNQAQLPPAPKALCRLPQGEAGPFSFGGPGPHCVASMQCASPRKLGELFLTSPFCRTSCAYEDGEPASPNSALVARQSSLASRASTGSLQALRSLRHTDSLSSAASGPTAPSCQGAYDATQEAPSCPLLSTTSSFSTTATQSMRLPPSWLPPLPAGHQAPQGEQRAGAAGVVEGVDEWEIAPEELLVGPRVGIGSYGEVYRGRWRHTCVAIKRLLDQELNEEVLSAFRSEVTIMKRLRHPNILQFIGACTAPPSLCIISPYCARGTLFRLLHRTPGFTPDELRRVQMALDVARGMNYLHSCKPPIVHRDLKSPNLLVDKDWTVKVCDFGLSRVRSSTWLSSRSQAGTPEWTAPEVLKSQDSNEKSDVYSFGVILWELLTGQEPWKDKTAMQVVGCVGWNDERLPIPETLRPEYRALIARCFAQQGVRPSFSEILLELKGCLHALRPPQPPRADQLAPLNTVLLASQLP